jgi:3-hydroxyanthranilate 3,4-dioxygenase
MSSSSSYLLKNYIEENRCNLQPPVCNKMIHNEGPLKVMIVGGPNLRKDYHLNQGEEIFYQIEGDMCLKVMEQGEPKDVVIKQGEVFILPGGVPHSPQRFANTVGIVIERERDPAAEYDGLRYYVDDTNKEILWQRFFHCKDLGKELVPLIKSFFDSEEFKTRVPTADSVMEAPWEDNTKSLLREPYPLASRFVELVPGGKPIKLSSDSKDYVAEVCGNGSMIPATPIDTEVWIWQIAGESTVNGTENLKEGRCCLFPKGVKSWVFGDLSHNNNASVSSPRLGGGGGLHDPTSADVSSGALGVGSSSADDQQQSHHKTSSSLLDDQQQNSSTTTNTETKSKPQNIALIVYCCA